MAAHGANGNTALQMKNSLHHIKDETLLLNGFQNFINELNVSCYFFSVFLIFGKLKVFTQSAFFMNKIFIRLLYQAS